jgi:hypothetical protein
LTIIVNFDNIKIKENNMKFILGIIIIILFCGCTRQNKAVSINEIINENIGSDIKTESKTITITEAFDFIEVNYTMYVNNASGRITVYDAPFFKDNRDNRYHLNDLDKVKVIKETGEIFNIGGYDGKWIYVISQNTEGWVFSGYLNFNEPIRMPPPNQFDENTIFPLSNIADISKYITWDLCLFNGVFAYSLDEALGKINLPEEYSVIKNRSISSRHDNSIIEEYFIIYDSHKFTIWANDDNDRYLLMGLEIEINEDNYSYLFSYDKIDKYLKDDNFGIIWEYGENYIKYFVETGGGYGNIWVLEFKNGLLYLIKFVPELT